MKGAALRYGGLIVLFFAVVRPAFGLGPDVTDADRSARGYFRDAATVGAGQLRLELRGMYVEDSDPKLELSGLSIEKLERREQRRVDDSGCEEDCPKVKVDDLQAGRIEFLGSYGLGANTEVGFDVPLIIQHTEYDGASNTTETDMGDVMLYTKFKRTVAEHCALAIGLELSTPTGIERKGFGTGNLGFNPFVSSRYQQGRFGVGAHVGYQMYTGSSPDVLNYSAEVFARGTERYMLRLELAGRTFKQFGDTLNDVAILPGFDLNVTDDLTVRPTAMANVTRDALEWGAGVGIAYSFSPFGP